MKEAVVRCRTQTTERFLMLNGWMPGEFGSLQTRTNTQDRTEQTKTNSHREPFVVRKKRNAFGRDEMIPSRVGMSESQLESEIFTPRICTFGFPSLRLSVF